MNEVPSSQFRLVFGKLREPTVVTVNGHPIGEWTPRLGHVPEHLQETLDLQGYSAEVIPDADKVRDLQDEVHRLKQELAKRPPIPGLINGKTARDLLNERAAAEADAMAIHEFEQANAGWLAERKAKQEAIDATLAKVNRKTKAK